jgi:type 1 glutamine amidotransferase
MLALASACARENGTRAQNAHPAKRSAASPGTAVDAAGLVDARDPLAELDAETLPDARVSPELDARADAAQDAATAPALRVSLFSKTAGYRHDAIAPAQQALQAIAASSGLELLATEDAEALIAMLPQTDVIVFLFTTGDVLDDAQQRALETFIRAGGGFVGVHSAADTEYDWPFYGELIVSWFKDHPATLQSANALIETPAHVTVEHLTSPWVHRDEWYNFRENPRAKAHVTLTVDEASYTGGSMGKDHPIAWYHDVDQGRAYYTALGHPSESWIEPDFVEHVQRAIVWAGRR